MKQKMGDVGGIIKLWNIIQSNRKSMKDREKHRAVFV